MTTVWSQCLPTYNSQCTSGDLINSVVFNTINNSATGCSSPGTNNYTDYTSTISTNVIQNTAYTIDVQVGPSWGQYVVAYIDFNNDLDFDDAGEFFDIGYAASGTTVSNTILIPNGIPGGAVTMRVLCKYSSAPVLAGQACNNFSYGECEDYTLNISSPLPDDAGITAFVTPSLPTCNFNDSIRVELYNYGSDTLTSAIIDWTVNATSQTSYPWTGSITPYSSEIVNLGFTPLTSGDNIIAFTSMPNGVVESPNGAWNDSSSIASLQAGLSGTYTIGGTTPDYVDFNSAVADISLFGICGALIFDVRDGIYNEQIDLTNIQSDTVNTITFRSENSDASLVTLSFAVSSAATNYIVKMSNTDYVTFEDLTFENSATSYGRVIDVSNGSDYNHFENCHFRAITSTSTSTNYAVIYSQGTVDNGNEFINNTIEGGSYGAYWYGAATNDLESGTIFNGNTFLDNYYYGLRIERQDAPVISGNSVIGESTYTGSRFAIYINYCDNGFTAENNVVKGSVTSGWRYGMYILNCDATNANHSIVANNMIQVGQTGNTGTFYGLYMSNDGYIDVSHNSVSVSEGGTSSRAYYATSGGGSTLTNNIFVNYTAGYAIYLASNYTISSSNNNLFHSPVGNVGYYGGAHSTLADWQTASGDDANSVDMDPIFHSMYDLHICNDTLKGLGMPSAISSDIDGQSRDTLTPDMGADEFTSLSTNFLGNDVEFCTGEIVTLSVGTSSDTILWSTGDTTTFINISTPGTYFVSINGVCGIGADTIDITMSNLMYTNFLLATDTTFCEGDSTSLSSSMVPDSYSWSTTSTAPSIDVTTSGSYTLDIIDACGSGTDNITITVLTTPAASFTSLNSFTSTWFTNTTTGGIYTTYFWDFGDGSTSTLENPEHVFINAGPHSVTLTATNECGTDTYNTIVSMVGINELSNADNIIIYPNPSSGNININMTLSSQSNVNVTIKDVLGKTVYTSSSTPVEGELAQNIDLTKESAGVYFIHIGLNGEITTKKIILK